MENNGRNKIIIIVSLATIFGFTSGIVGFIFARAYLFEKVFNIPFLGNEISFMNSGSNGSSFIFSNPKKVIVEQNTKVIETVNSGKESIVGIFKKSKSAAPPDVKENGEENVFDINNFFLKDNELGQGFVLTSDGWIITNFIPEDLKLLVGGGKSTTTPQILKLLSEYKIITNDKKIYAPDNIIFDDLTEYSYWHIEAKDLPVKRFITENEINIGQLVVAVNWEGWSWLSTIEGLDNGGKELVLSSDEYLSKVILTQNPDKEFYNSFLFSLDGGLAALIGEAGEIISVSNFLNCIECLLKDEEIKRAFLGVNYIDLNSLVGDGDKIFEKGALIYRDKNSVAVKPGSPAEKAGLKEGDIILSIDNIEISDHN
ncbi:hypothetical protein DRH27_05470, partial [Candidatus Falkowbacteria bacterium]